MNFDKLKLKFEKLKLQRDVIKEQIKRINLEYESTKQHLMAAVKARSFLQEVGWKTQQNLSNHINFLVSSALASVYPDPYEFKIEFVRKRNKVECELWLEKNGERLRPDDSSVGGGVLDVVSFACRMALWSLNKTRPVMILDEPFKFLHSNEYQARCAEMVKNLSDKLKIQFIIVTDQDNFYGDRVYKITNGKIEELK